MTAELSNDQKERVRVGVDLGGTKIEFVALEKDGRELHRHRVATPRHDYDGTVRAIKEGVEGIEKELPLEPALAGNAYSDQGPRVPTTLRDALAEWEKSQLARQAFGDEVVEHYANGARVELAAFDAAVTDWELRRGFERF